MDRHPRWSSDGEPLSWSEPPAQSHAGTQIATLLSAEPEISCANAQETLQTLEKRHLGSLSAEDLDPARTAGLCCFDLTANGAAASWTAHTICLRCRSVHTLLNAPASSIYRAIVGAALQTTDCLSAAGNNRDEQATPTLPLELAEIIVDFAVEAFVQTKDGSAIYKLMHVASRVRRRVCKAFDAVRVYEHTPTIVDSDAAVRLPYWLGGFVGQTLEWALQDMSIREVDSPPPLLRPDEPIVTTAGLVAKDSQVEVELTSFDADDATGDATVQLVSWSRDWDPLDKVGSRFIYKNLTEALVRDRSCKSVPAPEGLEADVETAAPRALSIFERALRGRLDIASEGVEIDVRLTLSFVKRDEPDGAQVFYRKQWFFHTRQTN